MTASVACKTGVGNSQSPVGNIPAGEAAGVTMIYSSQAPDVTMGGSLGAGSSASTASTGGGAAHDNMQPYAVMQYRISAFGIFRARMMTFVRRGVLAAALMAGASTGLFASDFAVTRQPTPPTAPATPTARCAKRSSPERPPRGGPDPPGRRPDLYADARTGGPPPRDRAGHGDLDITDALTIEGNGCHD